MGVKISKRHSFYTFKDFATKLLLQTPYGRSYKNVPFRILKFWVR